MDNKKTIYVDFDGTLAANNAGKWPEPGLPIRPMVDRVKRWIREGHTVKIFTARLDEASAFLEGCQVGIITDWCEREGLVNLDGSALIITNRKGRDCDEIWDDRAVSVNEYGNYTSMHKTAAAVDYTVTDVVRAQSEYAQAQYQKYLNREAAEQQMWAGQLQRSPLGTTSGLGYSHTPGNTCYNHGNSNLSGWLAATNAVDPPQDNPPTADTLFEDLDAALTDLFDKSEIFPDEGTTLISRRLEDGTYEYFPETAENPCYCTDSLNVVCDIHRNDPPDEPNGITVTKIGHDEYLVGFDWAEPHTR